MAYSISILFQPLSHSSFRWQGEFGPQARGPQAYALSMVLPLPSTVAGLLAGQACSIKGQDPCHANDPPYGDVEHCLRLLGDIKLRGPYIYIELEESPDKYVVCMPYGRPGRWKLYCVSDSLKGETANVSAVQSIGIALDSLSKIVLEGYIYTAVLLDLGSTAANIAERKFKSKVSRYGILVEVYGNADRKVLGEIDGRVVVLGGEQKPARVQVVDGAPALAIAEQAVEELGGCCYWHIVSPILCCSESGGCGNTSLEEIYTRPRQLANNIASMVNMAGVKASLCRDRAVRGRLTFTAIGLGYDMCRGRKRKYCRALMPGAGLYIKLEDGSWRSLYENGVGSHSSLGWGTIIPVPEPSEPP